MIKKNRRQWKPRTRVNNYIRAIEVRVLDAEGQQLGVMKTRDAITLAKEHSLDLVEIAPNVKPPVCKICNFGKFKYEESKKNKKNTTTTTTSHKVKEIQITPHCGQHDFDFKLTHAINFLCSGMKVKILLKFRGRENAHKEYGFDIVERLLKEVEPYGKPDSKPRLAGRNITVFITPLSEKQRADNPRSVSS